MRETSGSVGRPATLGKRIGAFIIDHILVSIVMFVLFILLVASVGDSVEGAGPLVRLVTYLLFGLAYLQYFILLEGLFGHTIGKKLVSIRVVDESGGQIGIGKSVIRNLLRIVDVLPSLYVLGIVLIAVSDDEQRVGDKAAGTYVVKG